MAKRILALHREFDTLLNQRSYYRTRQQKDDALNFASRSLFGHYYGNTEAYAPDKPLPAVAYAVTQAVNDALRPFERSITYRAGDATPAARRLLPDGRLALPASIVHPTSVETPDCMQSLHVTAHDRKRLARRNPLLLPDKYNPLLTIAPPVTAEEAEEVGAEAFAGGFEVFPAPVAVTLTYLGFPTSYKYATKITGLVEEFDDANSVDAEWPETATNALLTRALEYLGLSTRDQMAVGVAGAKSRQGDA